MRRISCCDSGVELLHQGAAQFGGDGFQRVYGVVGIHGLDDVGGLLLRQLAAGTCPRG